MNPVNVIQLPKNNPPFFVKDCFPVSHFLSYYNEKMSYTSIPRVLRLGDEPVEAGVCSPARTMYEGTYKVYTCSGLLNLVTTVSMVAVFILGIIGMTGVLSPEILILSSAGLLTLAIGAQWLRENDNSKTFDLVLTSLVSVTILILGCYLSQSALLTGSVAVSMPSLYALIGGVAPRLYHFYKRHYPSLQEQELFNRINRRLDDGVADLAARGNINPPGRLGVIPPTFFEVLTGRRVTNQY